MALLYNVFLYIPFIERSCLTLPAAYKQGQLLAYRLLCMTVVQRPDLELTEEQLSRFYLALHHGLVTMDDQVS